ncbi:MAG TPA: TonB-dependent hemoglobin/transferrin/lactoferrin family receptor [Xanthobacteraceae bacterium]|nr:TonB-dependent hemoglobin/transferrin/lactoferrin family receptor [Xanthobacteraceae bacterium]
MSSSASAQSPIVLDTTTVVATKTEEPVSDTLGGVSAIRQDQIQQLDARQAKDLFIATPGVWTQTRADDPGQSINIRGLQDFGRVAVTIDGARQNFQRSDHNADGQYYVDPELIGGADVARGPVSNIYGSGAIGGVVVYRLKDAEDILKPGEKWAVESKEELSSNKGASTTLFGAARIGDNIDVFFGGTFRKQYNYKDGNGETVPNTGSETWTGTAKITLRPAEGSTIKLGYTQYDSSFNWGQPFVSDLGFLPAPQQLNDIYATAVKNQIANARWLYTSPDNPLVDLDANIYWTRTQYDQTKVDGIQPTDPFLGAFATAANGDTRTFSIETAGFDVHNTSRTDTGPWKHAVTYGVDGFRDHVFTAGFDTGFTPSGTRTVGGGFVQWKANYSSWLEVISAVRYDSYNLSGGGFESDGSRVSPKITVGVTPFKGFQPYVSYSEGYRAPALTETIISGIHPAVPNFPFLPNPTLMPEVGKNQEVGINLKYDNVFSSGDSFRGKINAYRNNVGNFIQLVTVPDGAAGQGGQPCVSPAVLFCEQYQNVQHARLQGAEFESMYDTGSKWFAGLAASYVHGRDLDDHTPLATVPPYFVTTTLGNRITDRFTAVVRWQHVGAKPANEIPTNNSGLFAPVGAYDLVNLYLSYQISPNALAALSIENLLNKQYSPYMQVWVNDFGPAGAAPVPFPNPGITVKGSLKIRFGG